MEHTVLPDVSQLQLFRIHFSFMIFLCRHIASRRFIQRKVSSLMAYLSLYFFQYLACFLKGPLTLHVVVGVALMFLCADSSNLMCALMETSFQ